MTLEQIVALAVMQGLTEFLPISSSAHLILLPVFLGWKDQGLAFDVAVHAGTLAAVVWYFRKDLILMTQDWVKSLITRQGTNNSRLAWAVLLGTIPVGLAGLLLGDFVEANLRSTTVIMITTLVFGMLLLVAEKNFGQRDEYSINWKDILAIGVSQALALIPGTSRSGITITTGILMGLSKTAAARFSFLLSIPVIVLAGGLKTLELVKDQPDTFDFSPFIMGAIISALCAYACIHFFLKLLEKIGLLPFVIYRLALTLVLYWWII